MKIIDNTPIEDLSVDWGDPDGTGTKAKSLEQVQAFIKNKFLGLGYTYIGTASPSTTPMEITAEDKVFYIAVKAGDYTGFGQNGITELTILKSEEGRWIKEGLGITFSEYESNGEYIRAYTDNEGKFLWGIKIDGSIEWAKGVPSPIQKYVEEYVKEVGYATEIERINQLVIGLISDVEPLKDTFYHTENPNWISVTTDSEGKILEGIDSDGKKYLPKQEMFDKYDDDLGRIEIVVDAENKVLAYRDKDGVRHENKMSINKASIEDLSVKKLNLSTDNANQIKEALDNVGFTVKYPSDFSDSAFVELPIPRVCASVRLIVPKMPTSKTDDIEGYLEYNDKDGNYFKKPIILNSQGSSSMGYINQNDGSRGNLSVDFDDGSEIKFGDWVSQDSFHIKKYYIDAFRGQCVVGYHLMEQVYQTHPYGEKKPFDTILTNNSTTDSSGNFRKDYHTGALCHPDGFPIVIYVNKGNGDEFYGVYAWCLKKHRDNYYCNKSNPDNIILDGEIGTSTLFGGNVLWNKFEIRNPKDLIDINGDEYDGESPKELSDTDPLSAEVKSYIERLSGVTAAMTANNSRETFEQYFLPKYYIDFFLTSQVLYNIDGLYKNWIWCTWDGQHWTPTLYDVDSIFGAMPLGTFVSKNSATSGLISGSTTNYLSELYAEDIKQRYKELRDKGVFTVENIVGLLNSWLDRVGYQNLKDDLEKFDQTPSYRASNLNANWEIASYTWDLNNNDYDNTRTYNKGDTCYYYGYQMKAKVQTVGNAPFDALYPDHPQGAGFYNSLQRVTNWLKGRIAFLDKEYEYNN